MSTTSPDPAELAAAHRSLTFPTIAIVNDVSSGLDDVAVASMVAALSKQVLNDFGPAWRTGAHLHFVPAHQRPPSGMWTIALLDNSDTAGALGYHDLTPDGLPLGKVFAGTDRAYGLQTSVTLSHELLEMLADPYIASCVQSSWGIFFALEVCDAVEADELGYLIDGVPVSNFVTPAWFGGAEGRVDHLRCISAPFQLAPGGYISAFDPSTGQGWTQLTDRVAASSLSNVERALARPRVGSRRERRFSGRPLWVPSTYEIADGPNELS